MKRTVVGTVEEKVIDRMSASDQKKGGNTEKKNTEQSKSRCSNDVETDEDSEKGVRIMMLRIRKNGKEREEEKGLLDSGATHAIRPREEEDKKVKNVTVELAGNMKVRMMMNDAETIVGKEGIPMIVPHIPLMKRLKCTLSTNRSGNLQIEHPKMGTPPVDSSS